MNRRTFNHRAIVIIAGMSLPAILSQSRSPNHQTTQSDSLSVLVRLSRKNAQFLQTQLNNSESKLHQKLLRDLNLNQLEFVKIKTSHNDLYRFHFPTQLNQKGFQKFMQSFNLAYT